MKKIYFFIFLLFLFPTIACAYLPSDFGKINGETIWMGWTTFESGTVGVKNEGYASIHKARQVAYGRYQFHIGSSVLTDFLKKMIEIDPGTYGGFQEFVDNSRPKNGTNPYFTQNKSRFVNLWRYYAGLNDERFYDTQDELAYNSYYKATKNSLKQVGIDLDEFGPVLKGTVWSVAIRDGTLDLNYPNSQTYKALVNTYEKGISDEEYLNKIMASEYNAHTGQESARWGVNQKTMALAAMKVEDKTTTYKKDNIGGSLGGLLEDPFKSYPNLFSQKEISPCKNTFVNKEGELTEIGKFVEDTFTIIKLSVPIIIVIISTIDYIKALAISSDEIKKTTKKTIKRFFIGLLIFFLPYILELIFYLFGLYDLSTCGIT